MNNPKPEELPPPAEVPVVDHKEEVQRTLELLPNEDVTARVQYVFLDVVGFTTERSVEAQSAVVATLNTW